MVDDKPTRHSEEQLQQGSEIILFRPSSLGDYIINIDILDV